MLYLVMVKNWDMFHWAKLSRVYGWVDGWGVETTHYTDNNIGKISEYVFKQIQARNKNG